MTIISDQTVTLHCFQSWNRPKYPTLQRCKLQVSAFPPACINCQTKNDTLHTSRNILKNKKNQCESSSMSAIFDWLLCTRLGDCYLIICGRPAFTVRTASPALARYSSIACLEVLNLLPNDLLSPVSTSARFRSMLKNFPLLALLAHRPTAHWWRLRWCAL